MTHSIRTCLAAFTLACAAIAPAPARGQTNTSVAAQAEGLTAQQRDMLALATELARRCTATIEKWIANKEITEAKLFSFLYYPILDTNPPKFHTDYDHLSDRDILPLEESALARSSHITYAVIVDKNGYIPSHNKRYAQPLSGNRAQDLLKNRTKIIHNHSVGLTAARSEAPFLFQQYKRDTGEILAEVAVPVSIRGVHWGAIRVGYRPGETR